MSTGKKAGFALSLGSPASKHPIQAKSLDKPQLNSKHKQRFILGDDDEDDEDGKPKVEMVIAFEDNKAQELTPKEERKPLSITPLANVDWRKQKKQIFVPAQAQGSSSTESTQETVILNQNSASYGLQVPVKKDTETLQTSLEAPIIPIDKQVREQVSDKSLDAQAVEALIRDATGEGDAEDKSIRVISADETDLFRDDVRNRPDEATMDDYDDMPVEEFGAALLRGLGWNEGEGIGRNRKNSPAPTATSFKQRDALLGLGAKPEESSKEKKPNRRQAYEYKETSLFKKISKRRVDEDPHSRSSSRQPRSRDRSRSPKSRSPSTSSSTSSRRRHRDYERSDRSDRSDRSERSSRSSRSRDRRY